jgi:hypothetical protein
LESALKTLNWDNKTVTIDGVKLNNLPFADDIVIIVNKLREVIPTDKKVGLNINKQKTKIMINLVIGANVTIDEELLLEVREYKYLTWESWDTK